MSSHAHMYTCAVIDVTRVRLTGDDVYYTCQPFLQGFAFGHGGSFNYASRLS